MLKKLLLALVFISGMYSVKAQKISMLARGIYALPQSGMKEVYKNGLGVGAAFSYYFNDIWQLGIRMDIASLPAEESYLSRGNLSINPVMLTMGYHQQQNKLDGYVKLSAGMLFPDGDYDLYYRNNDRTFNNLNAGIGVGAGMSYPLAERLYLGVSLDYFLGVGGLVNCLTTNLDLSYTLFQFE